MTCATNILHLLAKPPKNPLFATKEGSLGMGLSISCTIVESHRGGKWLNEPYDARILG
jgi:phosphoglycerate-specific signal transduction histidine kinase